MTRIRKIKGGVCAAKGFLAGAVTCGIKTGKLLRDDLAIVAAESAVPAAATFTTNRVKAAPVRLSQENLRRGRVRAVVLNSGNANACTGDEGMAHARATAVCAADVLGAKPHEILVCSTGRIGVQLPVERLFRGLRAISLARTSSPKAAAAIMTSDTFPKEIAVEVTTEDGIFRVGGIAKGAGMIDPNMATMLCVVTTDAVIAPKALRTALRASVEDSFNRITVDGDMSTNDTVILLANGASGVSPSPSVFREALDAVTRELARMIVRDGEGVSRFVEVEVRRAASKTDARRAAEAIANSMLVKCAWAGGDPNWGRILDAAGYSGAKFRESAVSIFYDDVRAVKNGIAVAEAGPALRKVAAKKQFQVTVDLAAGSASHVVWTTDLTEEYVRLNLGE